MDSSATTTTDVVALRTTTASDEAVAELEQSAKNEACAVAIDENALDCTDISGVYYTLPRHKARAYKAPGGKIIRGPSEQIGNVTLINLSPVSMNPIHSTSHVLLFQAQDYHTRGPSLKLHKSLYSIDSQRSFVRSGLRTEACEQWLPAPGTSLAGLRWVPRTIQNAISATALSTTGLTRTSVALIYDTVRSHSEEHDQGPELPGWETEGSEIAVELLTTVAVENDGNESSTL